MKLRLIILGVLAVAGFGLFSFLDRSPKSLGIGSSYEELGVYISQKESRNHDRGLPPFWSTLSAGPYGRPPRPWSQRNLPDYYDGRMEVYTRFGLRPGHSFAVRQELYEMRLNHVVSIRKRWIWTGGL